MNTGERIKTNRKKANLTQEELARKAGISVFTLQKYETGARNPKLTTLQKIANALNCPISELKRSGEGYWRTAGNCGYCKDASSPYRRGYRLR